MKKKKLIEEFQKECVLSKKYQYDFDKDVCGQTIEVLVPQNHAKRIRKKLPSRWRGYRTIVKFREEQKKEEDEDEEEEL
jgi:hypothetical protein|tara:strand:+ start:119 stop:355 length:237 start_codon:yes stop_codon:yes gene_type:complete